MADYTIEVRDKVGNVLGELENAKGLRFSKKLNYFGSCSFKVPWNDVKLESLTSLRNYEVYIKRDENIVWAGEQVSRNGSLKANSSNLVEITCYDFLELLNHRYTGASRVFDTVDAGMIAWTLIDESQQDWINGDFGITQGTIETTQDRDRKYYNYNIFDAINNLSEVIGGFDFEINDNKIFNVYAQKGMALPSVVFEWGTNIEEINIFEDFVRPANKAIVLGEGFEASQLRVERNDTDSQEIYKIREMLSNELTVSETVTLQNKGDAILRKYKQPLINVSMSQVPNSIPTFGTIGLGDAVKIKVVDGIYKLNNMFRVYGYDISVDDDNRENISYTVGLI